MEELAAARDSDQLCRLLVQSPWEWGSSIRHGEAVSLLRGLRGGTLPGSLVALLLCACRRQDRVTAKLIAAVEECGVLSGPDLDELADSLLSDEVVAVFPLAWISGQWLWAVPSALQPAAAPTAAAAAPRNVRRRSPSPGTFVPSLLVVPTITEHPRASVVTAAACGGTPAGDGPGAAGWSGVVFGRRLLCDRVETMLNTG